MIELINYVLEQYPKRDEIEYKNSRLADVIRNELPKRLVRACDFLDTNKYKVKGSAGNGRWAAIPWVAIMDRNETTSTQEGRYPVILFAKDKPGFYLSMNQGVEKLISLHKEKQAREILKLRAINYGVIFEGKILEAGFSDEPIKLTNDLSDKLAISYEYGNIFSKYYERDNFNRPDLLKDISSMINIYNDLLSEEVDDLIDAKGTYLGEENLDKKLRFHSRLERNQSIINKVKNIMLYKCMACKFEFEKFYSGDIGERFIEAHHLKPLSTYDNDKIRRVKLKVEDFVVLCSNCHRMIHKVIKNEGRDITLEEFIKYIKQ